jgi:mersacidin/lichenicidin family type 2 lantibiotic
MKKIDIARAWKDSAYRRTLTPDQLASLPANPVEIRPATDEELSETVGAARNRTVYPDCCNNSTIGPIRTNYPDCCDNSTIGPRLP